MDVNDLKIQILTHFKPEPESLIVLKCEGQPSQRALALLRGFFKENFPGRPVMILPGGWSLETLTDEDLAKCGLYRVDNAHLLTGDVRRR